MSGQIQNNSLGRDLYRPKYVQLKERLLELIGSGELELGGKIPSLAQIKRRYGTSDTTYRKAISELMNEGVLRGEWGKGVFVRSRFSSKGAQDITLIVWNNSTLRHPAFAEFVSGIMCHIGVSRYQLSFVFVNPATMDAAEIERRLSNIQSAGVIVSRIPGLTSEHLAPLRAKGVPTVCVIKDYPCLSTYYLGTDLIGTLSRLVNTAFAAGMRDIALLGVDEEMKKSELRVDPQFRGKGFKLRWERNQEGRLDCDAGRRLMAELLAAGDAPGMVIAYDDYVALGALEAIESNGLRTPEDIQLVGIGGFLKGNSRRITSLSTALFELGETAAKLAVKAIEGKENVQKAIIIPCKLEFRDTCRLDKQFNKAKKLEVCGG